MRIFGLEISRAPQTKALAAIAENRGGWFRIFESWPGAWQHNEVLDRDTLLCDPPVFAAISLISQDISKLRVKLVQRVSGDVWEETTNPAYSPVLRHPNPMQTRIQFWEAWMLSKLIRGNTYVLKFRDNRNVVTRLYILDPNRVVPMVADDGSVFYQLMTDNIAGLERDVLVPAREIIHDRFNCMFHPLVGVSPLYAAGLAATQGLNILTASATFFANRSMPGGILTAPGAIGDETAARLKAHWDANYTGENFGKVAVLGDGLKFEPIASKATDSQLIEQLKWTAELIASTFHVPPYKIGIGAPPTYNNIQALNVEYYQQALQSLIEAAELCMDDALGIGEEFGLGVEFDIENLLRMDSVTQMSVLKEAVGAGIMAPNEARRKIDLKPVEGGESPYLQEQNFSLAALAKRDAQADPWAKSELAALPAPPDEGEDDDAGDAERDYAELIHRAARRYDLEAA
jgi:HK97 family phage portal protein